jgi:hypothetical protein
MLRSVAMAWCGGLGICLIVAALCGWQRCDQIAAWSQGALASGPWSVRCAAVGLGAAGEALLLVGVVWRVFKRDALSSALGLSALLVMALCLVSAVALGLAGR